MKLKSPRVLILGHARHGKDTFAEYISKHSNLNFKSSSEAAAEVVFSQIDGYNTVQECFEDRVNHRLLWRDLLIKYNTPNATKLAEKILSESNLYVGMRSLHEFNAAVNKNLFDYIFYVTALNRLKSTDPSLDIDYNPKTMILIDNNETLSELESQAKIAVEIILEKTNLILQ
jgi:hypothetical protein